MSTKLWSKTSQWPFEVPRYLTTTQHAAFEPTQKDGTMDVGAFVQKLGSTSQSPGKAINCMEVKAKREVEQRNELMKKMPPMIDDKAALGKTKKKP